MKIRKHKKSLFILIVLLLTLPVLSACSQAGSNQAAVAANTAEEKEPIVFTDAGWDSIRFHNAVAMKIVEEGYGYPTSEIMASEQMSLVGVQEGDINVYMEVWTGNIIDIYKEAVDSQSIIELGINYADNKQGLYVPTYLIKGDPERGIEPMAPDLNTVKDLDKYWEVFKDEEDPTKGRIYGSIPGWTADEVLQEKIITYGLDGKYNYFQPGSSAALAASITRAYENGEPWVGYYWEPTWVTGMYDMTLLSDEPYDEEKWNDGYACEFASQDLTIAVDKDFPNRAPEVVEFLKNYQTNSDVTSSALAYMQDNEAEAVDAAEWFLKEYEDLWTQWVPAEIAEKVKQSL
jgi:glycine betaine/proline transport system substrate-binding protein